jgi:hypothetical protein
MNVEEFKSAYYLMFGQMVSDEIIDMLEEVTSYDDAVDLLDQGLITLGMLDAVGYVYDLNI